LLGEPTASPAGAARETVSHGKPKYGPGQVQLPVRHRPHASVASSDASCSPASLRNPDPAKASARRWNKVAGIRARCREDRTNVLMSAKTSGGESCATADR